MSDTTLTDIRFENFDLHENLLRGLNDAGFLRCTPIQAMTLPITLAGKDVAGQAQTGTGKTAAFLVALFNRLLTGAAHPERRPVDPRAVILAPTRELAIQIDKDSTQIGRHTGLRTALIYGGVDYDKQRALLESGVDVIIATPGRLIDFVKQHAVSFRGVEMMIMDEADRMFDLGFIADIRFLLRRMPEAAERQNLLFSATLSHRVLELAYEHMNDPEKLVVEGDTVTASSVRQQVYFPATEEKLPLLIGILKQMETSRGMVFVNTKYACERVALALERSGYKVGVLSGDVPQRKRESLLGRFTKGEFSLLVATDVAARGLHIPGVSHVFNFDLPYDAEDYVHRIGRTARLGAEGDAISFACDEYAMHLPDIETFIGLKIPVVKIDPAILMPVPRAPARHAGAAESVVENALSEAAAERQKRRERDRRDGGGSGGGARRPGGRSREAGRAGAAPARGGERTRPPRHDSEPRAPQAARERAARAPVSAAPAPVSAPVGAPAASSEEARRRRGGNGHGNAPPSALSTPASRPAATAPAGLITRLLKQLKAWFGGAG
ncbi:MAG: DEAD/DEAH box helicase [Gammaproteobacteria bacterium]|nr:DEAD/DEAH box helicase [Gammaproteobacteria bacterium]